MISSEKIIEKCKWKSQERIERFFYYTLRKLCLWVGILFSCCPSVRPSVTFCILNIFKSHGWNFIKPCIHIHIFRANTYNKRIRARGHFYESYFPL